MKLLLVVSILLGSFSAQANTSKIFSSKSDCKAVINRNYDQCVGSDCRAIVSKVKSLCVSYDCKAIIKKQWHMCVSEECKAVVERSGYRCEGNDKCRAIVYRDLSLCEGKKSEKLGSMDDALNSGSRLIIDGSLD